MQTIIRILTLTMFFASANLMAAALPGDDVIVLESKKKNLFIFKIDKELLGSEVVVTYSTGEEVASMTMKKKKVIIDFCDVKFGVYTIKVMKDGNAVEEFTFNKELIISQVIR